jgi:protein-S-isoprenylcysteine O-methyltransferase Ste14
LTLQLPQTLIHWLLTGTSASIVLFFAAGLTLYFERGTRPGWVMALHYGSLVLALVEFGGVMLLPPRADPWVGTGIAMYMVAIALFLAAIEAAKRTRLQRSFIDLPLPDRLITDGPFRWIRHPFCTGYLLGALAGPVAIDHAVMPVLAAPLMLMTIYAAMREERVWLSGPRADEYRAYRRRTGTFVPFIGRR